MISYIFVGIVLIFQGRKTNLSLISFRLGQQVFVLNLAHSSQISIILFIYLLCVGLRLSEVQSFCHLSSFCPLASLI